MKYGSMDGPLGAATRPFEEIFASAKRIGLAGIEPNVRSYDPDTHPLWSAAGRKRVRGLIESTGVAIPSICDGILNRGGFTGDAATRTRAREHLRRIIEIARDVGARTILVPFFGEGEVKDRRGEDQAIEDLRGLVGEAAAAGVVLAVETSLPAEPWLRIVREVDSPACKVYYDIANAMYYGYQTVPELEGLKDEIVAIHVKDHAAPKGTGPLGQGQVPLKEAGEAIRAIGYDGFLMLETEAGDNPEAATWANYEVMRRYF